MTSLTPDDAEAPMDTLTHATAMTTRWRIAVRYKDRTPPFDAHPPVELRAPSVAIALDRLAYYKPEVEVICDEYGNPCIERRPGGGA